LENWGTSQITTSGAHSTTDCTNLLQSSTLPITSNPAAIRSADKPGAVDWGSWQYKTEVMVFEFQKDGGTQYAWSTDTTTANRRPGVHRQRAADIIWHSSCIVLYGRNDAPKRDDSYFGSAHNDVAQRRAVHASACWCAFAEGADLYSPLFFWHVASPQPYFSLS
jgi:hypothetical protein